MRAFALIIMLLAAGIARAEFAVTEILVIPWGDGDNQLKFRPLELIYHDPGGVAPGYEEDSGSGPSEVIVDSAENFIIYSNDNGQLKGFDNSGSLIFDYSLGTPFYDPEFFSSPITGLAVDSLFRLYIADDGNYVSVVDYHGHLVDKLYPFAPDSTARISWIYPKYDGSLCFNSADRGLILFREGQFISGCSPGLLASNGNHYSVWSYSLHSIKFNKYQNPDSTGRAETREFVDVEYPSETIIEAGVFPGGDGSRIYVAVTPDTTGGGEIWELDFDFNIIDKFTHNVWTDEDVWGISSYIHSSGTIYQFRCLTDGLHVIKWTKQ